MTTQRRRRLGWLLAFDDGVRPLGLAVIETAGTLRQALDLAGRARCYPGGSITARDLSYAWLSELRDDDLAAVVTAPRNVLLDDAVRLPAHLLPPLPEQLPVAPPRRRRRSPEACTDGDGFDLGTQVEDHRAQLIALTGALREHVEKGRRLIADSGRPRDQPARR